MSVPKHIGVIVDGNRRFAKKLMLQPWKGHEWGAEKFRKFTEWCFDLGAEEITAYLFSIQNFNRPKDEFKYLMDIFRKEIKMLLEPEKLKELNEKGIRIMFIGRQWMFPEDLQELQNKAMEATKDNKPKRINFAMAYGGREEIIDAVNKIIKEGRKEINEEEFGKYLWLNSNPDLIIRTGGEKRTSNFLAWQSIYSELMFLDKFWPEIEKEDVIACIQEYENRERRFGR
ncbi:di-trans,poly-cis-decaprenylcistransferase [Candidatus Woesearchaeota archaeon]|nr:di-trans,poly-cis-decaprenylcistransferase [Candidatus Woesearchaeota archaeon]MBW3016428.1 di-trans,poly-cis-decaprenylcistransferase [Candidatus Woesearchaeota archaeon]